MQIVVTIARHVQLENTTGTKGKQLKVLVLTVQLVIILVLMVLHHVLIVQLEVTIKTKKGKQVVKIVQLVNGTYLIYIEKSVHLVFRVNMVMRLVQILVVHVRIVPLVNTKVNKVKARVKIVQHNPGKTTQVKAFVKFVILTPTMLRIQVGVVHLELVLQSENVVELIFLATNFVMIIHELLERSYKYCLKTYC